MPLKYYTEEEYDLVVEQRGQMMNAFRALEDRLSNRRQQHLESAKRKHYPFIPLYTDAFLSLVGAAVKHLEEQAKKKAENDDWQYSSFSFLDVGCGPGTKSILAMSVRGIGSTFGLEFDPTHIPMAEQFLGKDRVFNVDGTEWEGYGKFDIIYMYVPICDHTLQEKLQEQVIKHAKPGAIILMAGCGTHSKLVKNITDKDHSMGGRVYQKLSPCKKK